jgi:hypothetical protein
LGFYSRAITVDVHVRIGYDLSSASSTPNSTEAFIFFHGISKVDVHVRIGYDLSLASSTPNSTEAFLFFHGISTV